MRDSSEVVFGSFDGATSALGALAGLELVHATPHTVLVSGGGLAAAAALGMAAGEYLADQAPADRLRGAAMMGAATFAGTMLPILPVALVGGAAGLVLCALLVAGLTVLIAEFRSRTDGRRRGYAVSMALIAGAAALVAALLGLA